MGMYRILSAVDEVTNSCLARTLNDDGVRTAMRSSGLVPYRGPLSVPCKASREVPLHKIFAHVREREYYDIAIIQGPTLLIIVLACSKPEGSHSKRIRHLVVSLAPRECYIRAVAPMD